MDSYDEIAPRESPDSPSGGLGTYKGPNPPLDGSHRFFRSRWVQPPLGAEELDSAELAPGFRAGAIACGLKGGGQTDVAVIACDAPVVNSALLLTRNAAAAAPVP